MHCRCNNEATMKSIYLLQTGERKRERKRFRKMIIIHHNAEREIGSVV